MSHLPAVRDGTLFLAPGVIRAHVETPEWFAWLQEAPSFTFAGAEGTFTARHEERAGSRFWYAYRRREGKLRKTYLGRSAELTLPRLEQAARTLAEMGDAAPDGFPDGRSFPLIATKIAVPQPGMVPIARPGVVARCLERIERPCTLIAAPAGFGKTTLLIMACEQLKERGWQVAWVSLEETEHDPVRFWRYALAGATTPIALVLDDYHRAATPASDRGLAFLIEHAPAALHLVVATRADPAPARHADARPARGAGWPPARGPAGPAGAARGR